MADEIIDFYKKAKEPEEPQKPIEEQKEPPVLEVPKPDEPFDRFLLELAEKLQKEKVISEKQQETFVEQIKEPVSTDSNENDPFKKFIGSFANILKEDELVNREENIKEATISFINKLKEQPEEPFIIKDEVAVKPKQKKYLPPKIAKKVHKLQQTVKKEEPIVQEQVDEPVKEETKEENTYVKELKTSDKTNKKIPEKIKSVSDVKSIVEKQVAEILSRYPNLGFTGGGGGTNAVQYAKGGTMDGDLNVAGTVSASTFLSGGVNLVNVLSSTGDADRLISGSESLILNPDGTLEFPNDTIRPPDETILTLESENPALSAYTRVVLSPYAFFAYDNEGNSITFDEVDNAIVLTSQDEHEWTFNKEGVLVGPHDTLTVSGLSSLGQILSAGIPLHDIFLTAETDSQTLSYDKQTELLSISNGNSVSLSSLNDKSYINENFLPLSGGTVYGKLEVNNLVVTAGLCSVSASNLHVTDPLIYIAEGNNTNLYDIGLIGSFNDGIYQHTGLVRFTTPYNHWALFDGLTAEPLSAHVPREDSSFRLADLHLGGVYGTKILSGGVDLKDIFLTSETDSQTLTFTESSAKLSISNGNTVTLSALDVRSLTGNWQETYTSVATNSANWNIAYNNSVETFETVSKNLKTYPYTINYANDVISSIVYTLPDSKSITKTFGYINNILTTVTLSGDLPTGINTVKTLGYTVNNILTGISYS